MVKLIFYNVEYGMNPIGFTKLLCSYTNLGLKDAYDKVVNLLYKNPFEIIVDNDQIAEEICQKSFEYKVLVKKEEL